MRSGQVLLPLGLLFLSVFRVDGQAITSATAGVLQFFEGAVTIDDRPVERKTASFPALKDGSTLRTHKGRAELLLSPGLYLRLDESSAVRMLSNALTDTRLELLAGSAVVDGLEMKPNSDAVLSFRQSKVRFLEPGVYRLDSDTGVLQAYSGKAGVESAEGKRAEIDNAHLYFLDVGALTDKVTGGTEDEFYDWARDRNESISAQNQLAAQNDGDPDDAGPDPSSSAGLPPIPYAVPPSYSYQAPYASGSYFNSFLYPYLGYGVTPFSAYSTFPIVLVLRPSGGGRYLWPHRAAPIITTGVGSRYGYGSVVQRYQPGAVSTYMRAPSVSRPAMTVPRAAPMSMPRPMSHH